MPRSITITALLLAVGGITSAESQSPFALEARAGAAVATADLGDASLNTGGGFELNVSYRLVPNLRLYAGWDWQHRATSQPETGGEFDIEDTGYAVGLRFEYPLSASLGTWLRGGGLYDHIEVENSAGSIIGDSGHELGWEVGGGLSVRLGQRFAVTPGARYRSLSATLDGGQGAVPVDLTYLAVDVGIVWLIGGF